jgi:hypothetical protein
VIDVRLPIERVSATPGVGNVLGVVTQPAPAPTDRGGSRHPAAPRV